MRSKAPVRPRTGCAPTAAGATRRDGPETRRGWTGAVRVRTAARSGMTQRSSLSLRAARRRADFDRGVAAISPGVGTIERRCTSSASGVLPHTHTGKSGGQMQPWARPARKRLTRRAPRAGEGLAPRALDGLDRDRREAAADGEQLPGERQRGVKLGELAVDRDTDRLE